MYWTCAHRGKLEIQNGQAESSPTETCIFHHMPVISTVKFFTKVTTSQLTCQSLFVQFLWNFFISKEAVAAGRRYEKERHLHACKLHLEQGHIYSHSSPSPPHPPPTDAIREAGWVCFLPPPSTHALPMLNLCSFQRPRPKARMASI